MRTAKRESEFNLPPSPGRGGAGCHGFSRIFPSVPRGHRRFERRSSRRSSRFRPVALCLLIGTLSLPVTRRISVAQVTSGLPADLHLSEATDTTGDATREDSIITQITAARQAIRERPDSARAHKLLGMTYSAQEKWPDSSSGAAM